MAVCEYVVCGVGLPEGNAEASTMPAPQGNAAVETFPLTAVRVDEVSLLTVAVVLLELHGCDEVVVGVCAVFLGTQLSPLCSASDSSSLRQLLREGLLAAGGLGLM